MEYSCKRCKHTWDSKLETKPKKCPSCGNKNYSHLDDANFEYPQVPGYFPFSRVMDRREDLDEWRRWFDYKGYKTKVVKINGYYALYREGKEAIGRRTTMIYHRGE